MKERGPDSLHASRSISTIERGQETLERFQKQLEQELYEEVERILREEAKIGEGRAAQVFNIDLPRSRCKVCVKIFRPENASLPAIEQKQIQYLTEEEEFNLQDELFMEGIRYIPRPIAYGEIEEYKIISMERIPGYTLKEIVAAGARITNPSWAELMKLLIDLNKKQRVLHRDIHMGNIMLKTEQALESGAVLSGELYFIDFGCSKRIFGEPTHEDYSLTIGNHSIEYINDKAAVDDLNPRGGKSSSPFLK